MHNYPGGISGTLVGSDPALKSPNPPEAQKYLLGMNKLSYSHAVTSSSQIILIVTCSGIYHSKGSGTRWLNLAIIMHSNSPKMTLLLWHTRGPLGPENGLFISDQIDTVIGTWMKSVRDPLKIVNRHKAVHILEWSKWVDTFWACTLFSEFLAHENHPNFP